MNVTGASVPLNLPTPKSRGFLSRWPAPELSVWVLETPDHGRIMLGKQYLRSGQSIEPEELRQLRYVSEDYRSRPGRFVYEVRDRWRTSQAVIALNARPRDFVAVLEEPMELTPGESHEFRFVLAPPEDDDPTTLKIYAAAASGSIDMHDGNNSHSLELDTYIESYFGDRVESNFDHSFIGGMALLAERTLNRSGELHLTYTYEPNLGDPYRSMELIIIFVAEDIHGATTEEVFVAVDNGPETCAERLHPTVSRETWMEMIPSHQEDLIQKIISETGIATSGSFADSREIYRGFLHEMYTARDLEGVKRFIGWFSPRWLISEGLAREFRPLTEFAAGAGDLHAVDMLARFSSGTDRDMWRFVHDILSAPSAERLQLAEIDLYAPEHRPWDNPFAEWSTDRDMTFAIGRKRAWRWLACHLSFVERPPARD